jgi:hypothetical protein
LPSARPPLTASSAPSVATRPCAGSARPGRARSYGAIVHHFIGYDRYEGERAYRQFTEVYRALRLSVNFFQPSMKLKEKTRDGNHVQRRYDAA